MYMFELDWYNLFISFLVFLEVIFSFVNLMFNIVFMLKNETKMGRELKILQKSELDKQCIILNEIIIY